MQEKEKWITIDYYAYLLKYNTQGNYKSINENNVIIHYKNGMCSRLDGPTYIDEKNKIYRYFINSKQYTKEKYYQHTDVIQYRLQKFQESMK